MDDLSLEAWLDVWLLGTPLLNVDHISNRCPKKINDMRQITFQEYFLWIVNRLFTCFYLMVLWFPTFDLFWFYGVDWWPCWIWPINSGPRERSDFWIQQHLAIVVFPSFFCSSLVVGHPQLGKVSAESTHGKPAERHQLSYGLPRNKWSWIYIYKGYMIYIYNYIYI